jgi:hypothetical protein
LDSEVGTLQKDIAEENEVSTCSVQPILREPEPSPREKAANRREHERKLGRPSKVVDEQQGRIRALLEHHPNLPATDVFRYAGEWWCETGRSRMAALVC